MKIKLVNYILFLAVSNLQNNNILDNFKHKYVAHTGEAFVSEKAELSMVLVQQTPAVYHTTINCF